MFLLLIFFILNLDANNNGNNYNNNNNNGTNHYHDSNHCHGNDCSVLSHVVFDSIHFIMIYHVKMLC